MSKLNFDGSSLGNPGLGGFGGVVRNHEVSVLWAFSGLARIYDSMNQFTPVKRSSFVSSLQKGG